MTALPKALGCLYRKPAFIINNTCTYLFGCRYFYTICQVARFFWQFTGKTFIFFRARPGAL